MYSHIVLALLLVFVSCCNCYNEMYKGQQVWEVDAATKDKVENLIRLLHDPTITVERQKFASDHKAKIDLRVGEEDINRVQSTLESFGLSAQVLVPDVSKLLKLEEYRDRRWRSKRSITSLKNFDYSRYHTLDEIERWMDLIVESYNFVTKFKIGTSFEGRVLSGLHVSLNDGRDKPTIYIDAATHAREWIAPATLMYICKEILSNPCYSRLLEELDFYFVPVVNLDGYAYTWSHARLWRKTRRPPPQDDNERVMRRRRMNPLCYGVDANRNWDINFGGDGSESDPCSILYHGPRAESEPVIEHLANFLRRERTKIKAVISLHNFGQEILYPYNYNFTLQAPTEEELNSTAYKMKDAIKRVHGKDYTAGRGSVVLYVFSGSTSDWAYEKAGIELSYTLELRDTGRFHFELPANQILPTGEEIIAGVEVLANTVIDKHGSRKAAA